MGMPAEYVTHYVQFLIFKGRFIDSCACVECTKGAHWLLDPCLASVLMYSFLLSGGCCCLLPALLALVAAGVLCEPTGVDAWFLLCAWK